MIGYNDRRREPGVAERIVDGMTSISAPNDDAGRHGWQIMQPPKFPPLRIPEPPADETSEPRRDSGLWSLLGFGLAGFLLLGWAMGFKTLAVVLPSLLGIALVIGVAWLAVTVIMAVVAFIWEYKFAILLAGIGLVYLAG